jgi:hypothetical protein
VNRLAAVAVGLALIAAPARSQDAAQSTAGKSPNYYPLKEGSKWEYKLNVMGQTVAVAFQINKTEMIGDKKVAVIETVVNGNTAATEHIESNEKGIFRHKFNMLDVKPALPLLKYPVKKGDAWVSDVEMGGQKVKADTKVNLEEVTVPAGKYEAAAVSIETEVMGQKVTTTYWFAPNVGIVKQIFNLGGVQGTMELEKYTAGN